MIRPLRLLSGDSGTEVYEAIDLIGSRISEAGDKKILKVLNTRREVLIEALQNEADALQQLAHPGIPRVALDDYFVFQPNGFPFQLHCLALNFFEGENLEEWIQENGKISQEKALDWLSQLGNILHNVHEGNFFHRDIKPSNIILQKNGSVALIDFGGVCELTESYMAKIGSSTKDIGIYDHLNATVVSTAFYTPPEQLRGRAIPQSDFYSLGKTLIYLCTGKTLDLLAKSESDRKTMQWHHLARQIDKPLAEFIDRLQQDEARKRPLNTVELLDEIKQLPSKINRYRRFNSLLGRVALAAVALAVLSLIGWGASFLATQQLFRTATEQRNRGELKKAKKTYQTVVSINPRDIAAHNNLAGICLDLKDFPCALNKYKYLLKTVPASRKSLIHFNLGSAYDEYQNFIEFRQLNTKKSKNISKKNQNYMLAKRHYRSSIQLSTALQDRSLNNIARIDLLQGNTDEAVNQLRPLLKETDNPIVLSAILKNLGWGEYSQGNYDLAHDYLLESISKNENQADSFCLLLKVGKELGTTPKPEILENCLLLYSELPEVYRWKEEVFQDLSKGG